MNKPSHPVAAPAASHRPDPCATPQPAAKGAEPRANLPEWASTPFARRILDRIIADRPDYRVAQALFAEAITYRGKDAAHLRQLFRDGATRLCDAETAAYRASEPHRHLTDALQAYLMQERPDALIGRVLRESRS